MKKSLFLLLGLLTSVALLAQNPIFNDEKTGVQLYYQYNKDHTAITITGVLDKDAVVMVDIPSYISGDPVTAIGNNAFSNCSKLALLRLPETLRSIGSNQFINTENSAEYIEPVVVVKEVSESFSFLDEATQPYLYDKTTGLEVKLAKRGEDPHGIMLPYDFKYPLEKVCIKDAYKDFNNWVDKDPKKDKDVIGTNWYTKPVSGKVYTK